MTTHRLSPGAAAVVVGCAALAMVAVMVVGRWIYIATDAGGGPLPGGGWGGRIAPAWLETIQPNVLTLGLHGILALTATVLGVVGIVRRDGRRKSAVVGLVLGVINLVPSIYFWSPVVPGLLSRIF